jgi:hypothetical protein
MPTRQFAKALNAKTWHYADADPEALLQMGRRIAAVGKRRNLIHYSELVRGITLHFPNVDDSHPFELGVPERRDVDRAGAICPARRDGAHQREVREAGRASEAPLAIAEFKGDI